ncbi:hypothetical protein HMPREF9372_0419 [Sporosarcina newyorkensis 2681]|uniref:Uncharacterized protein n=1 Tax=Sporosarcina newyorkensis 2681 TaxID=1027292 RepID=F9DNN9_9BACL|nr:hypothetical protein HMPREF9372_0419 [Sporosarcina newyorkensis 2681]
MRDFFRINPIQLNISNQKNGEYSTSSETFPLEEIIKMQVTFEGKKIKESDKIALLAFLQTLSGMKSSE